MLFLLNNVESDSVIAVLEIDYCIFSACLCFSVVREKRRRMKDLLILCLYYC